MRRRERFFFRDVHLPMKGYRDPRRQSQQIFRSRFQWHLFRFEMPIRVGRDSQFDALLMDDWPLIFRAFSAQRYGSSKQAAAERKDRRFNIRCLWFGL